MENKISLGLDIGVASVGFSVIDAQEGKVLELGARLFNSSVSAENQTRRDMRGSRRLSNRKKQRRKDVAQLFKTFGLINYFDKENYFDNFQNNLNSYELRVKGLSEKLSKEELVNSLYHIVKRRGISYDLADADTDFDGSDYSSSLNQNQLELQTKTPAEIQLTRLNVHGAVRGKVTINGEDEDTMQVLLNVFPTKSFVSEAKKIIQTQQQYYPDILTDIFETKYLEILERKREYFVGPGSEKSRTDFGIYKKDGRTLDNLFEELIGHDKIYPDELRASGASYTAQVFNVLNDLNNLRISSYENGKISTEDKIKIVEDLRNNIGNVIIMKIIKKVAGCEDDDIKGYRLDSKDKPDIHSMAVYRKVHRDLLKYDVDIIKWPTEFIDELSPILTLNTENGEIRKQMVNKLQPKYSFLTDELIQVIINNKSSFDVTSNNKWHRFSLKTMNVLIEEMFRRPVEQMTLIQELGLIKDSGKRFENCKLLPYREISKDIFNPVASKSVREALKIVNAVMKKYGQIDYLVIEMPRDKNEEEMKKQIEKFQKENNKQKDEAINEFVKKIGNKNAVDDGLRRYGGKLYFKIRLWYQQDGIDLYNGKVIEPFDLLNNINKFEVDHIIPESISFDDSINNKTLCYADMNQIKGQKTPFEFMNEGHGQGFAKMKAMVNKNSKLKGKRKNYLFDENISDIETRKRFISRNLVDTQYSSRVVLNSLQEFFKEKETGTKVTVVRGKFTSNLRKHWHINKTRDTFHHHAIDASIIAATPFLRIWKKDASLFPMHVSENTVDIETGEILNDTEFKKDFYGLPYSSFIEELNGADDRIKFSHQVDRKMNRKVSDATIYSTRKGMLNKDKEETDYVLGKIKNIYDVSEYNKFKRIYDKDPNKFLLAHHDPKSFDELRKIMQEYPSKIDKVMTNGKVKSVDISPFELYRRKHGMVQKYSNKNKGPVIKQLKYLDKKLGSHIDITPKDTLNDRHVVLQSLKPWRTDVYYNSVTGEYEIMGIKYSDLKFNGGEYGIKMSKYLEIKEREQVSDESEFLFTLYKRDRIQIINCENDEIVEMLFWSRNNSNIGYAELKPVYKYKTEDESWPVYGYGKNQILKRLVPKNCKILKVNTDILGNPYYIKKESKNPKNILD
ncbi:type II CRISPR RNA-guided endonuclease Cas9 [Companilactobacillus nodensis]|uniref:CRISPR-associated endonuclease Cas9 n=1 Tax=Companilactobacillus nodensis DSM 19682 = JCM 14932 = NBRC 107160 TaxID=1423775 RepID=A0A0R1KIP2_9LACO|nr:type II CRISPR RNA-guided endonuclease Cas9 [Companilactobacillus nodensis]KRK79818.1 CRISPR-associated protein, Csn1 family [Companilactobacillus nodensis DSM 19682 = JCM 14932 = NBRC 107160]